MSSDLWAAASADIEAETAALELTRAKVACASVWPFLAEARSEREFAHRVALAADTLIERAGPLYEKVVASLAADFRAVTAAEQRPGKHRVIEDAHDPELGAHFPAGSEVHVKGHYTDEDGTTWAEVRHGRDSAFIRPEHLVHKDDFHTPESGPKGDDQGAWELNRKHDRDERFLEHVLGPQYRPHPTDGNVSEAPWGGAQNAHEDLVPGTYPGEQPRYPHVTHHENSDLWVDHFDPHNPLHHDVSPSNPGFGRPHTSDGLPIRSLNARGFDEADGEAEDDRPTKAELNAESDGAYDFNRASDPAYLYTPQSDPWHAKASARTAAVEYFDEGLGAWVAAAAPGAHNPAADDHSPEQGPFTGETGTFPAPPYPDPQSPLSAMYPAEPQPWTVTPGTEWRENPMQFNTAASRHPFGREAYFDGGPEGVAGEQSGFPADVSLPEPDEDVDFYGTTAPETSSGSTGLPSDIKSAGLSSTGHRFYDPTDPGVRMVRTADANTPGLSEGASNEGPDDGATPPPPPPSMTGGPGSSVTNANVPQTTPPAQMPGGGGMPGAAPTPPTTAMRRQADSRELFNDANPSGLGDEFRETQVNNSMANRPRQSAGDRRVNTPQAPARPIETRTSTQPRPAGGEDEGDEEDED